MSEILSFLGSYYGLDWATLCLGTAASWFFSNHAMSRGFALAILACMCGLMVAIMSQQGGFIVYNMLLIAVNLRGLVRGDRRAPADAVTPQDAPAPVPVR